MTDAARVKGNILTSRLAFVRGRGGEALLGKVLGRLPADDQRALKGTLLVTSAYPLELNLRLDNAIAAELSPGDRQRVFIEMGRASAEMSLSGPQRGFLRAGDPHGLLAYTEAIYSYYYSVGRRIYQKTGPTSACLTTFDAEGVTETDCLTVVGWHERAIELSGGSNVRVSHPQCRVRGALHCEYLIDWGEPPGLG